MLRLILSAALLAVLPWSASAQVEKQVEVTKAYVPSVESAQKLAVEPDMTDTVTLRPEIDYTITPLSLRTTLATRPIRPAKVTYWEFNRPLPFYLKAGAGYPLQSVLDFYASSQNPSRGYVVGYVNHEGRYADIENDFGVKNNSLRMRNRVGAAAGKYMGRHVLEGEVSYDNRIDHAYGFYAGPGTVTAFDPGGRVMYGDLDIDLRFGDDFQDLRRLNFEVALHGELFTGKPDGYEVRAKDPSSGSAGFERFDVERKMRQATWGGSARIARTFGRHRFGLNAGYEYLAGHKALENQRQQQVRAGLRYGIDGGVVRLDAGADYYHDRVEGAASGNYLIPFLRLDVDLGTTGLKPFLEVDGGVYDNSFRSLVRQNPYLADGVWKERSSVDYNGRFGVGGSLWHDRFTYRAYAGLSIRDNRLYWYSLANLFGPVDADTRFAGPFHAHTGRQTVTSIHAEVAYRPVSVLRIWLDVHGSIYNDEDNLLPGTKTKLENGLPSFEGNAGIRYEGRKVAFGVSVMIEGARKWTSVATDSTTQQDGNGPESSTRLFTAPLAVDLRADVDWKVSSRTSLFAEGRNLLNRKLYRYAWFPEYGANFTLGVMVNF